MTPDCLVLAAITTRRSFAGYSLAAEAMMTVKLHASTILAALAEVQSKLVGKAVVLTDGKAGTVENVWLDELHGLRISMQGPRRQMANLDHKTRANRPRR